jgi:hypothetical protein
MILHALYFSEIQLGESGLRHDGTAQQGEYWLNAHGNSGGVE